MRIQYTLIYHISSKTFCHEYNIYPTYFRRFGSFGESYVDRAKKVPNSTSTTRCECWAAG